MTRIIADISASLDGFVAGPGPDNGLGTGGEALHTWAFSDDPGRRSAAHAAAAKRDPGIDRDAPDLRRLPVIR